LVAEYFQLLQEKTTPAAVDSNNWVIYLLTVISAIVVWLFSAFVFHLFALLFGGVSDFGRLLRNNAFAYIIPAISFVSVVVILHGLQMPNAVSVNEFMTQHPTMQLINWLINGSYIIYFVMLVFSIKYLYQLNYIKSIATVATPVAIIYVLSLLFTYVM
jgi:hypothetical protein